MRPDPGRELLDERIRATSPEERALASAALRARGFASVWDQLDRAGPLGPVEQMLFLLDHLYPELPPVHRASIRRQLEAAHESGSWSGPRRPDDPASPPGR